MAPYLEAQRWRADSELLEPRTQAQEDAAIDQDHPKVETAEKTCAA